MMRSSRSSGTEWLQDLQTWGYVTTLAAPGADRRREAYTVRYMLPGAEPAK